MLRFTRYDAEGNGYAAAINPRHVSAVIDGERRVHSGAYRRVATIILRWGEEIVVFDDDRQAAHRIEAAQKAAAQEDRHAND